MNTVYVCTGSCHGVATHAQYEKGARTCGAKTCERHGMPLEPREQCASCSAAAEKDGKAHMPKLIGTRVGTGQGHACINCTKS